MTTIPTFNELRDSIVSDLEAEFSISIPIIGKAFLWVLANIYAMKLKLAYLYLAKVQKNLFADQAETTARGGTLERIGFIKLGRLPNPARAGEYVFQVNFTGAGTMPAGTIFVSADTSLNPGKLFIVDADFPAIGAGVYEVPARAAEAGMDSKLTPGENVLLTAPIAFVESQAVVLIVAVAPRAAESTEEYRQKVLQSYRLEAQGGATADYILWGLDAPGTKRIYPYAVSGESGEVVVYVEATIADSTDGRGTPDGSMLVEVEQDIIQDPDTTLPYYDRGRKPAGTFLEVLPIELVAIDIYIYGYDNRTAETDAINVAATNDLVANTRPFIAAADDPATRNDIISRAGFFAALKNAIPSAVFTDVTMEVDGVLLTSYQFDNGKIPYIASLSYYP